MGVPVPTDGFVEVDLTKARIAELQSDPWIDVLTEADTDTDQAQAALMAEHRESADAEQKDLEPAAAYAAQSDLEAAHLDARIAASGLPD
jgi:hypothetical protein